MVVLAVAGALLLIVLAVVAFVPLGSAPGSGPLVVGSSPLLGKAAPEIDLLGLEDEPLRLSDYRGRPVIVNFWATWCFACREEFALLAQARETHASEGLEVLGVVHDDTADGAREFVADVGATWPMPFDAQDVAWNDYLGAGLPLTFFVDPEGIVRAVSFGPLTEAGLRQQLATILPPTASPGPSEA